MRSSMTIAAIFSSLALIAVGCGDDGAAATNQGGSGGVTNNGGAGAQGGTGAQGGMGAQGGLGGGGGAGAMGGSGPMPVAITFEARVGNEVFDCAKSYDGLGTSNVSAKITDFRFYIHDIELVGKDGSKVPMLLDQDGLWQYENLALVDLETGNGNCSNGTSEIHATVVGTVSAPVSALDGVSFKLGVPFELNHDDVAVAPSPLNLSGLFWSWNGGYKFLRIDSLAQSAATPFNIHIGSTQCQESGGVVTSCSKMNVATIDLAGFDPLTKPILVDYAAAVSGNDITKNGGGAPGCLSATTDPECSAIFDRFGIDIKTGSPKTGQTFFRIE